MSLSPLRSTVTRASYRRRRRARRAVILAVALLVFLLTALTAAPFIGMGMFELNKPVVFGSVMTPEEAGVDAKEIRLLTDDGLSIQAWEVTAPHPRAAVIFLSGIQYPSVTYYLPHAKWLQAEGYSSVLVEMRAHGESEGGEIALGMKEYLDVKAALDHIGGNDLPAVVFGVSMGGATAINAFGELPELAGLISLSAYTTWPDVFCFNMKGMGIPEPLAAMEKPFVWLYMGFTYGFSNLKINPLAEIEKHNGRPVLLMHSTGDSQVQFECFERLSEKVPHAETFTREGDWHFVVYDDALKEPWRDTEYAAAILGFLRRNF